MQMSECRNGARAFCDCQSRTQHRAPLPNQLKNREPRQRRFVWRTKHNNEPLSFSHCFRLINPSNYACTGPNYSTYTLGHNPAVNNNTTEPMSACAVVAFTHYHFRSIDDIMASIHIQAAIVCIKESNK
jgi:hypothetical protein